VFVDRQRPGAAALCVSVAMRTRRILPMTVCIMCAVAVADSYAPRTPAQKVTAADLIVHGVASMQGFLLNDTQHPEERQYVVRVLETLWPTNALTTSTLVVNHLAWTRWPESWWRYNSQTGVYFLISGSTALKIAKEIEGSRRTGYPIREDIFRTNAWFPLPRFDDWHEPETNLNNVRVLIGALK
jgi:hypothetical protein